MEIVGVSGGAGFIGSNFIHFLIEKNYKIITIDNLSYSGLLFNLEPLISKSKIVTLKTGKDFSVVNFSWEFIKDSIYKKFFLNKISLHVDEEKIKNYNINFVEKSGELKEEIENFLKSKEKLFFVLGSITDEELLNTIFPFLDYFLNFAAETHVDRSILSQEEFIFTDIMGIYIILKNLKKYKNIKKFLQISTDEVYGTSTQGSFREDALLNPTSPYAAAKGSADLLCLSFFKTFDIPLMIVRPSNNYGPRQYPEKFIPLSILKLLKGEKVPIYGNGKQKREWIHVKDCVKGIYTVMEKGRIGEIYNIGSGFELENIEVVKKIGNLMGKNENIYEFVNDRPAHDTRYFLDSSKTMSLGWKPEIEFEEGLRETINWYMQNKDFYFNIMKSRDFSSFYKLWYQKR